MDQIRWHLVKVHKIKVFQLKAAFEELGRYQQQLDDLALTARTRLVNVRTLKASEV